MFRQAALLALGLTTVACVSDGRLALQNSEPTPKEITVQADDGVAVFGTNYFAELPDTAPLIVLFHQGGSNGRAEYAPLIPWLNQSGYRAIAWDLRVGGEIYGLENRTAAAMLPAEASSYCDGYGDMNAALEASVAYSSSGQAIIWGSSYTGALVFHLAADAPDKVSHVISASPASGSPMADCLARDRLGDLSRPAFVLRPASEMQGDGAQQQKVLFDQAGVPVLVLENGIHGSSMLVDERTEADMSAGRAAVINWLSQ